MVTTSQDTKTPESNRRERRKEETRSLLLHTAMKLFAKKGIFDTTVEEITEAADVGKGTFFNYFPSKEAILEALAERQLALVQKAVEQAQSATSIRPILRELFHSMSSTGPARSQLMFRSLLGTALTNRLMLQLVQRIHLKARERVAMILERGQQLGEVRRDREPIELARLLQHVLFGTLTIWCIGQPSDIEEWLDKSLELYFRGVAPEAASAEAARSAL